MSLEHLGERFDIHTGGIDLKFPHHEDEIAQSEGALGHRVVSIWMHGEFLTMDDAKMAKSAGNIIRVADLPDIGLRAARLPLPGADRALPIEARLHRRCHARRRPPGSPGCAGPSAGASGPVDLSTAPIAGYRARFIDASPTTSAMPTGAGDRARGRLGVDLTDRAAARAAARLRPRARACRSTLPRRPRRRCRRAPRSCSSDAPPPAQRATSRPPTRCATSWPPSGSRSATRRTARKRPSAASCRTSTPWSMPPGWMRVRPARSGSVSSHSQWRARPRGCGPSWRAVS